MKVGINIDGMENLRQHALKAGTLQQWSELAMDWMRAAEAEVERLKTPATPQCTCKPPVCTDNSVTAFAPSADCPLHKHMLVLHNEAGRA